MYPETLRNNDHGPEEDSVEVAGVLFVTWAHTGAARRIATARIARACVAVILQGKL
jgi:hypothetical protein